MCRGPGLVALGCVLLLAACEEPRVVETLHCSLDSSGHSEVVFEARLPIDLPGETDEVFLERLDEKQREYLGGWDPWKRRFEEMGALEESLYQERTGGELRLLRRTIRLEDPDRLSEFFAGTDLTVRFAPGEEESTFEIFTGPSSRATMEQRERVERLLHDWSAVAVGYFEQVEDLYGVLDNDPSRAEEIFSAIFDFENSELTAAEEEQVDRLIESFLEVVEIAQRRDGETEGLGELVALVYDPFPALLTVRVDGRVLEAEGFVGVEVMAYRVPPVSLEETLAKLEEMWIEPPLLTTWIEVEQMEEGSEFDVAEFALKPRSIGELPSTKELRERLVEVLEPASEYRLRWAAGEE